MIGPAEAHRVRRFARPAPARARRRKPLEVQRRPASYGRPRRAAVEPHWREKSASEAKIAMRLDRGLESSNLTLDSPAPQRAATGPKARPHNSRTSRWLMNKTAFYALHTSSRRGLTVAAWSSHRSAQAAILLAFIGRNGQVFCRTLYELGATLRRAFLNGRL